MTTEWSITIKTTLAEGLSILRDHYAERVRSTPEYVRAYFRDGADAFTALCALPDDLSNRATLEEVTLPF